MTISELKYLATNLSNLTSLPVRIYKNNEYYFYYYTASFFKDPVVMVEEDIKNSKNDLFYVTTKDFFYYAFLKYHNYSIVLGPFRLIHPDETSLSILAFNLNLPKEEITQFILLMNSIPPTSIESVIQSLCLLNFVLTKEQKNISDIFFESDNSKNNNQHINIESIDNSAQINNQQLINNTYGIEKDLFKIIENGDIVKLKNWIKNAPVAHPGILANDTLRHTKNTFIATATLVSRTAIKGHMDIGEALSLSDLYIQKMELLQNNFDVINLQTNMIIDYTERIAKINNKSNTSILLINLNKYILSHLSDAIKSNDICSSLYVSKSVLFDKIKKETGMTLSNYILFVKINESKDLLKYSNRSISAISTYLGFSSQSHFNHAFKKITNTTPIEYRKTRGKK